MGLADELKRLTFDLLSNFPESYMGFD